MRMSTSIGGRREGVRGSLHWVSPWGSAGKVVRRPVSWFIPCKGMESRPGSRGLLCLEVCFELYFDSKKGDEQVSSRNNKIFLDVGKPPGETFGTHFFYL